jgi:hypothetical protein
VGAVVCAVAVIAGLTVGPLLGEEFPSAPDRTVPEVVSLPRVEHPNFVQAEPATRRRSRGDGGSSAVAPSATSEPQPTVIVEPNRPEQPGTPSRPPGTIVTPVPVTPADQSQAVTGATPAPAELIEPVGPTSGAGPAVGAGATPGRLPATSPALNLFRLRVASVAVVHSENAPTELRVGMGIAGAPVGTDVPDQITLRLRPDLPSTPVTPGSPLSLHAVVDVVNPPASDARKAAADPAPVQMRVRMALAPEQPFAPTVQDRSSAGDGQSNVIELTVPLAAFLSAPDTPGAQPAPTPAPEEPAPGDGDSDADRGSPGPGGSDEEPGTGPSPEQPQPGPAPEQPAPAPGPDTPAPQEPAPEQPAPSPSPEAPTAPPATPQPPASTEVRLDLTPPADEEASPAAETTKLTVPQTPAAPDESNPVSVTVQVHSTPAPELLPADVVVHLPTDPGTAPPPADVAAVPGLGETPAPTTDTPAPATDTPAPATDTGATAKTPGDAPVDVSATGGVPAGPPADPAGATDPAAPAQP